MPSGVVIQRPANVRSCPKADRKMQRMTLANMRANGVRKLSVCGSLAILIVIAMTSANNAARKPKEGTTQIHRACGKLPYSSFVECFDHFLKIGYGIKVTAPFCQYYCSR